MTLEDLQEYYWFDDQSDWFIDETSIEVPFETGRIEMWDGSDGKEWPHVHYSCRHCGEEHNFDVDPDDPNPRIHVCPPGDEMDNFTLVTWGPLES
jgi:hypothetical protein